MDYKYYLVKEGLYNVIYVYSNFIKPNNINKQFKLLYHQYFIKVNINQEEFNSLINKCKNNIIFNNNNILVINSHDKLNEKNAFHKFWFYKNKPYTDIINSVNDKTLFNLNSNLYNKIIGNFKFKDIIILLYNKQDE